MEGDDSTFSPVLCSVPATIIIKGRKSQAKRPMGLRPGLCCRVAAKCWLVCLKLEKPVLEVFWCWLDHLTFLKGSAFLKAVNDF